MFLRLTVEANYLDQNHWFVDGTFALHPDTMSHTGAYMAFGKAIRPVHAPWQEQTKNHQLIWEPDLVDRYTGPSGSPIKSGPSQKMKQVARTASDLSSFFFAISPWSFWERRADRSNTYADKDDVAEALGKGGKCPILKPCTSSTPSTRRRHRGCPGENKYTTTPLLVLV
jgi:hypothetical protein